MDHKKKFKALLFDLGFTLINFEGDFHAEMYLSYDALADSLIKAGVKLDRRSVVAKFSEYITEYYRSRAIDLIEKPVEETLQRTLNYFSIHSLPQNILQDAVKAMYEYTESSWKIEPDAHQTLETLTRKGYRLALISNAANSPDLNRLIDGLDLRKYFELVVISADEGIRKPDPRIFTNTLLKMGISAENAIMIGDTLPADVFGAQNSGIKSVWVTRRADRPENNEVLDSIQPDYTIPDLASLVDLLEKLEGQKN